MLIWLFVYFPCRNVYSDSLPIFKLILIESKFWFVFSFELFKSYIYILDISVKSDLWSGNTSSRSTGGPFTYLMSLIQIFLKDSAILILLIILLNTLVFYVLNNILSIKHGLVIVGFPGGASGKEHACHCRRHKRWSPGGGHGNPLWYSCLENSMDRGTWWAIVHTVTKSQTWLKRLSTRSHSESNRSDYCAKK